MDMERIEAIRTTLQLLKKEFNLSGKIVYEYLEAHECKQTPKIQRINQFINGKYQRLNTQALELMEQFIKDKKQILYRL